MEKDQSQTATLCIGRPKIALIHHGTLFDEALSLTFERESQVELVRSINDRHLLSTCVVCECEVAVYSCGPDDATTCEEIHYLYTSWDPCKIIAVGARADDSEGVRLVEAGAVAVVTVQESYSDLIGRILLVRQNETTCPASLMRLVLARLRQLSTEGQTPQSDQVDSLSKREQEILRAMSGGLSNKELADVLQVSVFTVKNHIHSILKKLKVSKRRDAIWIARRRGLADMTVPAPGVLYSPYANETKGAA
jgi:DNA-binding NarL/FixJ family response regulator